MSDSSQMSPVNKTMSLVHCARVEGYWNTRNHVYPGLENELVLTHMPTRKTEKNLMS